MSESVRVRGLGREREEDLLNGVTKLLLEEGLFSKGQHAHINLTSSCGCRSAGRLGQILLHDGCFPRSLLLMTRKMSSRFGNIRNEMCPNILERDYFLAFQGSTGVLVLGSVHSTPERFENAAL